MLISQGLPPVDTIWLLQLTIARERIAATANKVVFHTHFILRNIDATERSVKDLLNRVRQLVRFIEVELLSL